MSRNSLVIWGSVAVGLLGAILWVVFDDTLQRWMTPAIHNSAFQFWILVMLGGGISFAHQQFAQTKEQQEREKQLAREQKEEEKRILLRTSNDLLSAHNRTKRVRRLLRARVLRPASEDLPLDSHSVSAEIYDSQMQALVDAQLDFESIERRVHGSSFLFDEQRYQELQMALDEIGDYLHDTLEEYEDQRTEFSGEPPRRRLVDLPVLMEFLGPHGHGPEYDAEFEKPFRSALRCLRIEVQRRSAIRPREGDLTAPTRAERVSSWVLGLPEDEVRLVGYREDWPELFEKEAARLRESFANAFTAVEHIGSTAVPGLAAEPVLDLVCAVPSLEEAKALIPALAELGYEDDPDAGSSDRLFFCRWESDRCTHQLSIVETESDFLAIAVRLRDHLREHEEARREFEARKRDLLRASGRDPSAYVQGVARLAQQTVAEIPE